MSEPNRVALALMAHPDDAELLCAGTLIRLQQIGWEIHIVTMTAGDCGTTTLSAEQIVAIRREEATRGAAAMGGTYHCMDELDGQVVYDKETIRRVVALFRMVAPSLVFTHALSDYMMDHEITARLARNATQILRAQCIFGSVAKSQWNSAPVLLRSGRRGEPVRADTFADDTRRYSRRDGPKGRSTRLSRQPARMVAAHQGMDEYIDAMKRHAAMRGKAIDSPAAEAFVQHRSHGYPKSDLLRELLEN